ncbi:MAG TPA: histidine phosphatase family protein [Spirochaetia bacterium]|nr:histidine phosphatase family protein [Spirochaetia bacterium]
MRLYIIRHADPDYVRDTITEAGHKEARALSERLMREELDEIYSSPMGRAQATAAYTAEALRKAVEILPWTHEISDAAIEIEGYGRMAAWDAPGELVLENEADLEASGWMETPWSRQVGLMAHYQRIAEASDAFLLQKGYRRVGKRYEVVGASEKKIALFCHGGFGLCLLSHLLRIPVVYMWAGFWLPPSSVTTILFETRSERWALPRCLSMSDMSHLHAAGLPQSFSGLLGNHY